MKTSLNSATPASVVGAVGSVAGNVGGNVVGSVGSLAAQAQTDVESAMTAQGYTTSRAAKLDNADVATSTRLATSSYTAPDNTGIAAIEAKTDNLPVDPAQQGTLVSLSTAVNDLPDNTAASVWDYILEGAITAKGFVRLIGASTVARLSGAATATINIRNISNTKTVITATVDADGNRTAVTTDPS